MVEPGSQQVPVGNSFLQSRGEAQERSLGENCSSSVQERISTSDLEKTSPTNTTTTASSSASGGEDPTDLKTSRASLFPFLMPPFRSLYSQTSLQGAGQFDLLRTNGLIPYSPALSRTAQFPALHPFSLRGFPVHPSLLRQVRYITPTGGGAGSCDDVLYFRQVRR